MTRAPMNQRPDPAVLAARGEHFAAGYFELPDATPIIRWCRAVRRRLEGEKPPPYRGERLYPVGPRYTGDVNRILAPSYSFTWSFNATAWAATAEGLEGPERAAFEAFAEHFRLLEQALDHIRTPHTVGGRGYTHSIPHYGRVLHEGLDAYRSRIVARQEAADSVGDAGAKALCTGLADLLEGIAEQHAALTRTVENTPVHPGEESRRKAALLDALAQVPFRPARSFYEALVSYHLVFRLDDCDNPGRVDYVLDPYYRRDLREGRVSPGEAEELLREFWLDADANSSWCAALGGTAADGSPAYSELTRVCLRAGRGLRRPNLQLRIRRDMPDEVFDEALDTLRGGTGIPALYHEEAFLKALGDAELGVRTEDWALLNGGGCTEMMIQGHANVGSLDAGINLPLILTGTLARVLDTAGSFDRVLDAYFDDVRDAVARVAGEVNADQEAKAALRPQPMRSLLVDDCIDRGVEFNAGGARYNWSVVNVAGIANVADSLVALREAVFADRVVTGDDLRRVLDTDFRDREALRRRLSAYPRYGNGDPEADAMAARVAEGVFRELLRHRAWRGGRFLGSCLMFVTYAAAGAPVGATPDGRRAGAPLADSAGPVQGRDTHGPTRMLAGVAGIPHHLAPGTLVVNLRLDPALFDNPEGRQRVKALVRTYFDLGGMQLQINVADADLLRRAEAEPDAFPDLIVRIGGYSEYFCRLTPELRRTVLERVEHRL